MGMGMLADAGGSLANTAVGRITIDVASVASARTVVVREARLMGDELERIGDRADRGVSQATNAFRRLETGLERAYSRASALWGAFMVGGLAAAQNIKSLELRMIALSGSEQQAAKHMETLRRQAEAAGQPFLTLVEGATGLLPALRGTNADLGQAVMLAQRLAMMDPAQGVAGAAFAIREFLNGEYLSLTRRLELDRSRLREILEQADGDAAKAIQGLSRYIDEIGISEQKLIEMGQEGAYAFQVLRDEGAQTLSMVFTPFLNDVLIPITKALNTILRQARELDPALAKVVGISAGFMGTATIASRGLPLIGAIPAGGVVAKGAVAAGSLYVGSQLGIGLSRLAGNLGVPGFSSFEGKSQAEAQSAIVTAAKQLGVILLHAFTEIAKLVIRVGFTLQNAWDMAVAAIRLGGSKIIEAFGDAIHGLATIPGTIAQAFLGQDGILKDILEPAGVSLGLVAGTIFDAADGVRALAGETDAYLATLQRGVGLTAEQEETYQAASERLDGLVLEFGRWAGVVGEATRQLNAFETQFFSTMVDGLQKAIDMIRPIKPDIKMTPELLDAWSAFQEDMADVTRQEEEDLREEMRRHRENLRKETARYNERVEEETARYNERVADIERDYAQSRARAQEEFRRREAEISADLAERVAAQEVAYRERLAELIAQYNDRRESLEVEHAERMAQIQRDGRRDMLNAAMRLDASGVFAARQRMEDQQRDESRAYQRRMDELDKWLRQAQEQENRAYARRIEEAQRSAEKQLEDLRARYEREEQLARENRQARLDELRQQHSRELSELRTAHQKELAQLRAQHTARLMDIQRQAAAERQALNASFINTFNQLQAAAGAHHSIMINIQRAGLAQMEADLRAWWERQQTTVAARARAEAPWQAQLAVPQYHALTPRQVGGLVQFTGAYQMEQGEYVLRPDVTRMIDRMLGGNMTQGALLSALAGREARGDVHIAGLTVPVTVQAGAGAREAARLTGREVEQKVYEVLAELIS